MLASSISQGSGAGAPLGLQLSFDVKSFAFCYCYRIVHVMDTLCVRLGLIRGLTLLSRHHSPSLSIVDEFKLIKEYLAGEIFVLASESKLSLATGLASGKVSLEPCILWIFFLSLLSQLLKLCASLQWSIMSSYLSLQFIYDLSYIHLYKVHVSKFKIWVKACQPSNRLADC